MKGLDDIHGRPNDMQQLEHRLGTGRPLRETAPKAKSALYPGAGVAEVIEGRRALPAR